MDEDNDVFDDIKQSMKKIVEDTNNVLKHSMRAYKKIKEKTLILDDTKMIPSELTKLWFLKRGIESITIPEFFDLVFAEASKEQRLDFSAKTVWFNEEDAKVFGFVSKNPVSIIQFFECIPNYFD
jgi:hypothetical protein